MFLQVLGYLLLAKDVWKSWSSSVSLEEFFIRSSSGSLTISTILDHFFEELLLEVIHVTNDFNVYNRKIKAKLYEMQVQCSEYIAKLRYKNHFKR